MQKVEGGIYVSVHYKGTLADGEQFDTSEGRPPLEFKTGAGQMIKGFEDAVMGMALNEKKTFTLSPEDAYGERDESRTHQFPKAEIPPEISPEVDQLLALTSPEGQQIPARITAVDDEKVTVDLNHPLAGQSLTFEVEVVGINDTPSQQPAGCGGDCSCGCEC
jgi:peptidylprolyl isomerase